MPRQCQPPSLRKASLDNIACHFEDYWCAGAGSNLLEDSGQSDVFTPFQYLGDDMIQEIIDNLQKRGSLRPSHFQLLLHSNIRRLNLNDCKEFVDDNVIKTLGTRCQKLTHLNLRGFENDPFKPIVLRTLMSGLVSLDLSGRKLNCNVVKVISENCPNLLELDVWRCGLNDADLMYLCYPPTHPRTLPRLRKLSIDDTVSTDTVVHLLKSHRSLRTITHCDHIDHALDQIYGEEFQSLKEVLPEWIHNFSDISIDGISEEESKLSEADRLDLTFQCCPFLTELTLWFITKYESFKNVSKLKHLKTLCVTVDHNDTREHFSTAMAPLLMEIGSNLVSLECAGFDEVSLIRIGKWCLNLESLYLYGCDHMSEDYPNDKYGTEQLLYFTKLKEFHLWADLDYLPITTETKCLSILLKNATEIQDISLYAVENLSDEVFLQAHQKHNFRNLKKCEIASCSPISVEWFWKLLSLDNPIDTLTLQRCPNITIEHMLLLRHEAFLRQFDIAIEAWPPV